MNSDNLIRLVVIDDSLDSAEILVSLMRNGGLAVRPYAAEDSDALREVLQAHQIDLILCALDASSPALDEVRQMVRKMEKDIPLLGVEEELDPEVIGSMVEQGIRDVVSPNHAQHLLAVVEREIDNLLQRRRLRNCQHTLREAEKRCHSLLDSSRDAIAYIHEGMHIYANPVYLEIFGFASAEEVEGTPIMDLVAPEDHRKFKEFLRECRDGGCNSSLSLKVRRTDHRTIEVSMDFAPASIDGEPCTQIIIRQLEDTHALMDQLEQLTIRDLLTGLYNHDHFMEALEKAVSGAMDSSQIRAVLYLELDNYLELKERTGVAGSNLILSDVATLIRNHCDDEEDVACRFGDHSFAVLTSGRDIRRIEALAHAICASVEQHLFEADGQSLTGTCSIGIGVVGETADTARSILERAETACRVARDAGGNRWQIFETLETHEEEEPDDTLWQERIHDALRNNRFRLVFQPIASLHGKAGEKYEVLLRLAGEEEELISPLEFLPAAQRQGLLPLIDQWVIRHACRILAYRHRQGHDTRFFVKLGGASLEEISIAALVAEQLKELKLEPSSLVFEISETDAVTRLAATRDMINALRKLGCAISLEHFGNGVNSFQLLNHLEVDYLKIDPVFVTDLVGNPENQEMVRSIVDKAMEEGKQTIAHFVEDANSLSILWQCGVNYIQGNFVQEPEDELSYDFSGEGEEEEEVEA